MFTNIPVVQVVTANTIFDEPKAIARIVVNYPEENRLSDEFYIGIEYRGGAFQSFDKKS